MDIKRQRGRRRWTEGEDAILYDEAMKQSASGSARDWHRIATRLPGRTNKDCRKRWVNKVCGGLKKGLWDSEEDRRLQDAVEKHGLRWPLIANEVGFRSPDQCAKRWQYGLDPRLKHREWTPDEDKLLLGLVAEQGRKWKSIQHRHYPTRSRIDLKNRYTILIRRLGSSDTNIDVELEDDASDDSGITTDSEEGDHSSIHSEIIYNSIEVATHHHQQQQHHTNQEPQQPDWITETSTAFQSSLDDSGSLHHLTDLSPDNRHTQNRIPAMDFLESVTPRSGSISYDMPTIFPWDEMSNLSFPHFLGTPFSSSNTNSSGGGGTSTPRGPGCIDTKVQYETGLLSPMSHPSSLLGDALSLPADLPGAGANVDISAGNASCQGAGPMKQAELFTVCIAVENCDRDTLNYLLGVTKPIKGKVKMQITM